jgi:hypothetical protein
VPSGTSDTKENSMKNGYFHDTGNYAPETAIGTGAAVRLVDEVEAAEATPSVDESTAGTNANRPRANENSDMKPSGQNVGDSGTGPVISNGQEKELRDGDNQNVDATKDAAEVNKPAAQTRPAKPQNARRTGKAPEQAS